MLYSEFHASKFATINWGKSAPAGKTENILKEVQYPSTVDVAANL
jgi:hypothetical protein